MCPVDDVENITSADKKGARLVLENDGTLVLYNSSSKAIWNNTKGRLY